ncbi:MAG TPA: alpha/beta fold hydrolase [Mycobacteriales bacterium]|jgi:pimeloyl-ACP methyl ester carboxylesterase|nr:alpha/beta fold hydrolase [Mycobacteriales bacterium]
MDAAPRLFSRTVGAGGPRVVLLHGLLGQGRNLATVAAGIAARGYEVTSLDLPDHGRSPWTDRLDYPSLAGAVARELDELAPVVLLGHSLGGKTAMQVALRRPELLAGLVVVDIAPVPYAGGETEHVRHLRVMRGLDLASLGSRAEADAAVAQEVDDERVRGFLLQNLARDGDGWTWRAHLDVLARDLLAVADFPVPAQVRPYPGPVLWLAGADSAYVTDAHRPRMLELFPRARLVRFKGVGHWVHSEVPELFVDTVVRFLDDVTG